MLSELIQTQIKFLVSMFIFDTIQVLPGFVYVVVFVHVLIMSYIYNDIDVLFSMMLHPEPIVRQAYSHINWF